MKMIRKKSVEIIIINLIIIISTGQSCSKANRMNNTERFSTLSESILSQLKVGMRRSQVERLFINTDYDYEYINGKDYDYSVEEDSYKDNYSELISAIYTLNTDGLIVTMRHELLTIGFDENSKLKKFWIRKLYTGL